MLDRTKGFSFPQLRDRLPLFNGSLRLAMISLQREDYLALLEQVDLMVDSHEGYKSEHKFFKRIFRKNLELAYRAFFEIFTDDDKKEIARQAKIYVFTQVMVKLV